MLETELDLQQAVQRCGIRSVPGPARRPLDSERSEGFQNGRWVGGWACQMLPEVPGDPVPEAGEWKQVPGAKS